jgi:hypothetical protein
LNPAVTHDLEAGIALRLNLGSGPTPRPGFYSLDHAVIDGIDIVADLNNPLSLLPDNCTPLLYRQRHDRRL